MSPGRFAGAILAMLGGAVLLTWVVVCLAALVFALVEGNGSAAGTYALLLAAGLVACAVVGRLARHVAGARSQRH